MASVYYAVRTGSLKMVGYVLSLEGKCDLDRDLMTEAGRSEKNYGPSYFMYYGYFV